MFVGTAVQRTSIQQGTGRKYAFYGSHDSRLSNLVKCRFSYPWGLSRLYRKALCFVDDLAWPRRDVLLSELSQSESDPPP